MVCEEQYRLMTLGIHNICIRRVHMSTCNRIKYARVDEFAVHLSRRSQNCEKRLLSLSCLSVGMEFCFLWKDLHESWYFRNFRISIEDIKALLKSENNNTYFERRSLYSFVISRSLLLRMKNVADKICSENQNTRFMFNNVLSKL
jgi:hypothetical protein